MSHHPPPRLAPASIQFDPTRKVALSKAPDPVEGRSLGFFGAAFRVKGPALFPEAAVVQALDRAALTGFDERSIRLFRRDQKAGSMQLVEASGVAPGFGYAWAKLRRPGEYAFLARPRDRLVDATLQWVAREHRARGVADEKEARSLVEEGFEPLLKAKEEDLERIREFLLLTEMETGRGTIHPAEIRLGDDGAPLPFAFPGDATLAAFRSRIKRLRPGAEGLPEGALYLTPHPDDELRPPWPIHPGIQRPKPPPKELEPSEPLPRPWPPDPIPKRDWWRGLDVDRYDSILGPFKWWKWAHPKLICFFFRDWWMHHADSRHSGAARCSGIRSTTISGLAQRYVLGLDGPIISSPAIVGAKIYVGTASSTAVSTGGSVYKIDLETGTIEAQFTFSGKVGSRQGQSGLCSTPAVSGGKVYVSALTGKLYCLDAETLACLWVTNLRHQHLSKGQPVDHGDARSNGWSSPLVVNDRVYVGFGEGESDAFGFVYCLNANTGQVVWLFCTNKFGTSNNTPNVIPPSTWTGSGSPPAPFTLGASDPPRGASPWSSAAYDSALKRIYIGTGNAIPDTVPPNPGYAAGVLSLDASTGAYQGFFQPPKSSSYRPDVDMDIDVPAPPMLFTRGVKRLVAFGSKNGAFFLLDAATLAVDRQRQLLPYTSGGAPFAAIDPPNNNTSLRENKHGMFCSAAVDRSLGRVFVGVGGYSGSIDSTTTPFMRAMDWTTLNDAWPVSGTNPPKYSNPQPPMYTTPNESGLSAPAVVNDVVFMATTRPGLYAFDASSGLPLWTATGLGSASYAFGPAIYGNFVVNGLSNNNLHVYSL